MRVFCLMIAVFSLNTFAMPSVFECETIGDGAQFIFKGLDKNDSGDGYRSYTMVNMQTEDTKVLSVGVLGEDQAEGFVAFSGYMDQFSQSVLDRMCTDDTKTGEVKTLVLDMGGGGVGNAPLCLACVEQAN